MRNSQNVVDELAWRGWIRHNLLRIAALTAGLITLLMKENSDEAAQSEGEIRIPSLAEVKRELKRMKLILETKGHLIDPHMKAYLLQEILLLLNKVNTAAAESSTSQ